MTKKYEVGSLILRLVLGLIFTIHGVVKFQSGIGNIAGWFESIGIPGILAYAVASLEVVGGIAIILGLGTRIASTVLGLILVGAIVKVKAAAGFLGNGQMSGYEFDLALLAIAIYLAFNGSPFYSLDSIFNRQTSTAEEK